MSVRYKKKMKSSQIYHMWPRGGHWCEPSHAWLWHDLGPWQHFFTYSWSQSWEHSWPWHKGRTRSWIGLPWRLWGHHPQTGCHPWRRSFSSVWLGRQQVPIWSLTQWSRHSLQFGHGAGPHLITWVWVQLCLTWVELRNTRFWMTLLIKSFDFKYIMKPPQWSSTSTVLLTTTTSTSFTTHQQQSE